MSALEEILASSLPCRTVREDKLRGRLNHCYLVLTEDDAVRSKLCRMIAKIALCPNGGCGKCDVCEKIDDGAYTALNIADKDKMSVEDVKLLIEDTFFTGFDGDLKAYVVTNMQGMKVQAQNKFLKTLEEPSDGVVFILGATSPGAVLDTILSRCKKLPFEGFGTEELRSVLEEEVPTDVGGQDSGLSRGDIINRAAVCAFGSCTRARALAADGEFALSIPDFRCSLSNSCSASFHSDGTISGTLKNRCSISYTGGAAHDMLKLLDGSEIHNLQ